MAGDSRLNLREFVLLTAVSNVADGRQQCCRRSSAMLPMAVSNVADGRQQRKAQQFRQ